MSAAEARKLTFWTDEMDITVSYPEPKVEGPYSIKVEDVKIADSKFSHDKHLDAALKSP